MLVLSYTCPEDDLQHGPLSSHPASEHLSKGLNGVEVPSGWGQMHFPPESEDGTSLGLPNDATRKGEKKARGGGGEAGQSRAIGNWGRNVSLLV